VKRLLMVMAVGFLAAGCERPVEEITAPTLHYGQDMCAECSMIVSDERFAGAIGVRREGRVVHLPFDDIGEMLEYDPRPYEEIRWFAKDATTRQWLDAEQAFFLRSDDLRTPMGTGVGAYETRESAEQVQAEYGGEILDFTSLRPARPAD
jgi:copper chaperone NosL